MTKNAPAPVHGSTIRPDLTTFYLPKGRIHKLGEAIVRLQQRDDLSGKFARKVAIQRRAVTAALEAIQEERLALVKANAERYPAGHEKAGDFTPVYATGPDGQRLKKKDDAGNDTDEFIPIPDQFNLKDTGAFNAEVKELMEEVQAITLPHMKIGELEAFKSIRGDIMDALLEIEEGSTNTERPADFVEQSGLALVKDATDEPPVNAKPADNTPTSEAEPSEADRSAP